MLLEATVYFLLCRLFNLRLQTKEDSQSELHVHLNNLDRCMILFEAKEPLSPVMRYMRDQGQRIRHRVRWMESLHMWEEENIEERVAIKWPPK